MRLQPYLLKAPNLCLGAPNPRKPILPILRHQPQGLQPSVVNCLDLFGSNSLLPTLLDLWLTSVLLLLPRLPDLRLCLFLIVSPTCKLSLFSVIYALIPLTFGFLFARLIFQLPLRSLVHLRSLDSLASWSMASSIYSSVSILAGHVNSEERLNYKEVLHKTRKNVKIFKESWKKWCASKIRSGSGNSMIWVSYELRVILIF